jgi:uncharacterized phiE125 gp8 family phage protein
MACVESLERIGEPFEFPLTLAELREHLGYGDSTEHDSRLEAYLQVAVATAEHQLGGRVLVRQKWRLTRDDFPAGGVLVLPKRPVISLDLFRYRDRNNAWQNVPAADYRLDGKADPPVVRATLQGSGWPSTYGEWGSVELEFTCGYPDASFVPPQVRHFCKLFVAHLNEMREPVIVGQGVAEVPLTCQYLLDQLRVWRA